MITGNAFYFCGAYETSKDKALQLAWLVQPYLEAFTSIYGASYITPKFHHLVHLPDQIINIYITYKKKLFTQIYISFLSALGLAL